MSQTQLTTIKIVKAAVSALVEGLDKAPEKTYRAELAIKVPLQRHLSVEQTKTLLRKFHDALSHLDENLQVPMLFDVTSEDPVLEDIFKSVQAKIAPLFVVDSGPVDAEAKQA